MQQNNKFKTNCTVEVYRNKKLTYRQNLDKIAAETVVNKFKGIKGLLVKIEKS